MGAMEQYHGTTILGVKKDGKTVIAGDGQVSLGNTVIKPNAKKVRRLGDYGSVIGGFAEYFDRDPTLLRVLYVLISVLSAAFPGIFVYLILWVIVPSEEG